MIETWTPVKGVFSLVRVEGTDSFVAVPLHAENKQKREVLKLQTDPPPKDMNLISLASASYEMPGGKVDGQEELIHALRRELLEEAAVFFKTISHFPLTKVSLSKALTCYQIRGEHKLAIDVTAFYVSVLASNIQSLIDNQIARLVSLDDLDTIRTCMRPYQSAFLDMIYKGEICLPTQ